MKRKWVIWISVGMLLLGTAVILYPYVSSAINRYHGSYAIQKFRQQLDHMDSEEMLASLKRAEAYNQSIRHQQATNPEDYEEILDFGNGIMGYISIECIDLLLPIYHGVSSEVLEKGVGHLPTSAFPIGGSGNHTVLTGHTGLPSAKLFTDLSRLREGDRFCVNVGTNQVLYTVDQIQVVLPHETEGLMAVSGEDYCTLVTCTPYGINSHRLMIRGTRTEFPEDQSFPVTQIVPEERDFKIGFVCLPLTVVPFILMRCRKRGNDA